VMFALKVSQGTSSEALLKDCSFITEKNSTHFYAAHTWLLRLFEHVNFFLTVPFALGQW